VLATAAIDDSKSGYRETRDVSIILPIASGMVDLAHADSFRRQDFQHPATPGARYEKPGDSFRGKALKSVEKGLRERAISLARATLFHNPELGLASQPGEPRERFDIRCAAAASNLSLQEHARLLAKHEPRIRKLLMQRDAARAAAAEAQATGISGAGMVAIGVSALSGQLGRAAGRAATESRKASEKAARLREKVQKAEAELAEALMGRDSEIAARDAEIEMLRAGTVVREISAKKNAVTIEGFAIAWIPG